MNGKTLIEVLENLSADYALLYVVGEDHLKVEGKILDTVIGHFHDWGRLNRLQAENEVCHSQERLNEFKAR